MRYWAEAVSDRGSVYKQFFSCLFLIVPFSVCAGEIPQSNVTDPLPTAVYAASLGDPDIWVGGVGGRFRAETQTLNFSAGATYGMLVLGGEERHHLVPITVSYGRMVRGVKGGDHWYRGNWEVRAELFGGPQVNLETDWTIGVAPHLRYHFATGTRWIPYADVGAGITLTEIRAPVGQNRANLLPIHTLE